MWTGFSKEKGAAVDHKNDFQHSRFFTYDSWN